jgi:cell division protein FtsB
MLNRQRGMTFLGVLIIAVLAGLLIYAGIRLTPVYLEYMKVVSALEGTKKEFDGTAVEVPQLRRSIQKRFDIEAVTIIQVQDVRLSKSGTGGYILRVRYEHRAPYIANINFMVDFKKSVEIVR